MSLSVKSFTHPSVTGDLTPDFKNAHARNDRHERNHRRTNRGYSAMSADKDPFDTDVGSDEVWRQLAERREALEMCVEEDVPFADRAERLLDRLEEEGY
jgi:hypothetical protein